MDGDLDPPEILVWHSAIREAREGSSLAYWRLAFAPPYERERVFEALDQVYDTLGINSYIEYELLGGWDVLLRVWIPQGLTADDITAELYSALPGLRRTDYSMINEMVMHRSKRAAAAPEPRFIPASAISAINEYNDRQIEAFVEAIEANVDTSEFPAIARRPEMANDLLKDGILKSIPLNQRGVRLLVTFSHPNQALSPRARQGVLGRLEKQCLEASKPVEGTDCEAEISIYAGQGDMTGFLLMVKCPHPHFHRFAKRFTGELLPLVGLEEYEMRAYTTVLSDETFHRAKETLSPPPVKAELTVDEARIGEESAQLEFKGSFSVDIRKTLAAGRPIKERAIQASLMRAVCGMLNSQDGGRIVVGALELASEVRRIEAAGGAKAQLFLKQLRERFPATFPEWAQITDGSLPRLMLIGTRFEYEGDGPFDGWDEYQRAILNAVRDHITPNPTQQLELERVTVEGIAVAVLAVLPGPEYHYFRAKEGAPAEFPVREGPSTRFYDLQDSHLYREARPRR